MTTKSKHIVGFDYLRGLACILVILFHYTVQYQDSIGHLTEWPVRFPMMGRFGVITFFVLSGYLSLIHIKDGETFSGYCIKRASRLYPAYWVAIVLTSVVTFFLLPAYFCNPLDILVNFTMLQGFLGFANVDGVYWTLAVELIFYGFIGFIILFKCKKHILKFCYLWISVIWALWLVYTYTTYQNILFKVMNVFLIIDNAHIFIAGIALCCINKRISRKSVISSFVLLAMCVIYGVCVRGIYEGLFLSLISLIVHMLINKDIKPHKFLKPFAFYAKISYPAYLVHQFIGYAIIFNMERIGLTNEIFIIIPIAVSTLLAFLIHKFVEKPVLQLVRNRMVK